MNVLVFNQQDDLSICEESVKPVVSRSLEFEKRSTDELAVYFVSHVEMCRLHKVFFNDPSPTDCISFPLDETEIVGYHMLGEIFICPQTAITYTLNSKEKSPHNVYQETTLYLVHGILHLLGYDDIEKEDRKKMKEAERRHMLHLILHNTLLHGVTKSSEDAGC